MSENPDVQTTTSDVPNQLPDPSSSQPAPSLFAQQMAPVVAQQQTPPPVSQNPVTGGQQINGGNGQSPTPLYHDQSDKDTTDPRDFHPSVQNASIVRRVAETLAGGPRVQTTFDPQTGERKQTPVPLTSKQILLGAVANILGGMGQIASNTFDRMAGRRPQPIQPLPTQQAAQKQAEQSDEDFNRVQNQKLRKAKVLNANMEALRSAFALGKEDDEAKDSVIQNHADDLANWSKAGAVEASNVPSDELMTKGFDKTKYVAIPDGRVPVFNPDGKRVTDSNGAPLSQLTYSVVDGTTQAPLSQDKYNQLAKYGLMSAKDGFKLPEGASISSAQLALMNHKLDLVQQTQRELDEVHSAVGGEKIDLAKQIKGNPQMLSAIEQFHNDGASTEPDNQINNLQNSQNPKAKQAAGLMRELFGNDNLEKYKEAREARIAAGIAGAKKGAEIAAEGTPQALAAEKAKKQSDADIAEQARINAEDRKQQAKDRSTLGYVEDQSGKTYYVSKYDAQNNPQYSAQSFSEMKPSDVAKDRALTKPLGDVQMNLNHYRTATNNYDAAVQNGRIAPTQVASDRDSLTTIFSAPAITDAASAHAGAEGFGISVPTLSADLNAGLAKKVTNAYNALTPEGKLMADNYVRARAAIPAWVKALTNSGRGSKEQLDIELQNLLPPYYKTADIHNRLDGFQDNLENQKGTMPQNLLGKSIPASVTRGAQPSSAIKQGYTRIQASDGTMHDIPSNNLKAAQQRDPGLKVLGQ